MNDRKGMLLTSLAIFLVAIFLIYSYSFVSSINFKNSNFLYERYLEYINALSVREYVRGVFLNKSNTWAENIFNYATAHWLNSTEKAGYDRVNSEILDAIGGESEINSINNIKIGNKDYELSITIGVDEDSFDEPQPVVENDRSGGRGRWWWAPWFWFKQRLYHDMSFTLTAEVKYNEILMYTNVFHIDMKAQYTKYFWNINWILDKNNSYYTVTEKSQIIYFNDSIPIWQ